MLITCRFLTGLKSGHIGTNAQVAKLGGADHFWLPTPREVVSSGHMRLEMDSPGEVTNRL